MSVRGDARGPAGRARTRAGPGVTYCRGVGGVPNVVECGIRRRRCGDAAPRHHVHLASGVAPGPHHRGRRAGGDQRCPDSLPRSVPARFVAGATRPAGTRPATPPSRADRSAPAAPRDDRRVRFARRRRTPRSRRRLGRQPAVLAGRPDRILEIGCGWGRHSLAFARRGFGRVVSVDIAPAPLDLARALARGAGLVLRHPSAGLRPRARWSLRGGPVALRPERLRIPERGGGRPEPAPPRGPARAWRVAGVRDQRLAGGSTGGVGAPGRDGEGIERVEVIPDPAAMTCTHRVTLTRPDGRREVHALTRRHYSLPELWRLAGGKRIRPARRLPPPRRGAPLRRRAARACSSTRGAPEGAGRRTRTPSARHAGHGISCRPAPRG